MSQRTSKRTPRGLRKRPEKTPLELVAEGAVPSALSERQERLRRILIATRGNIDVSAVAEELGVHRVQIWRDRRVIAALSPPESIANWSREKEAQAIQDAIAFYEGAISLLVDEYGLICEYQRKKAEEYEKLPRQRGRSNIYNLENVTNLKLGIMNTITVFRRDLNNFMIQIGLIQEAPKRIQVEDGVSSRRTVDAIKQGIDEVRTQLSALRSRREALEARAEAAAKVTAKKKRATKKKAAPRKADRNVTDKS